MSSSARGCSTGWSCPRKDTRNYSGGLDSCGAKRWCRSSDIGSVAPSGGPRCGFRTLRKRPRHGARCRAMELAAVPPRPEQIAEAHSSRLLAQMKDVAEKKRVLGRLARRLYRRLSAAWQPSTPFPGSRQYWENRYGADGNSGVGSYGKFAAFKAEVINAFVV